MSDDVTITVSRADLEAGLLPRPASPYATSRVHMARIEAADRVRAAIPEPEWEPTEEQIVGFREVFRLAWTDEYLVAKLRAAHDVGLIQ